MLKAIKAAVENSCRTMNGKSPGSYIKSWGGSLQVTHTYAHTYAEWKGERFARLLARRESPINLCLWEASLIPSSVTRVRYAAHVCIHLQVKWLTSHSGVADSISPGLWTRVIDKKMKLIQNKTRPFMNRYKEMRLKGVNHVKYRIADIYPSVTQDIWQNWSDHGNSKQFSKHVQLLLSHNY